MSYRDDIDALAARRDALDREVELATRERDEVARQREAAEARTRPPKLDNMRIASPCTARWNDMTGDDRKRLCAQCNKDVYNLSGMTRAEAEELIVATAGKLCGRFYQRADGTILLADCVIGKKRKQNQRVLTFGTLALLAGGAIGYKLTRPDPERLHAKMGQIAGGLSFPDPPPPPTLIHEGKP
jgi:hypothetical protein